MKNKIPLILPLIVTLAIGIIGGVVIANNRANIPLLNKFLNQEQKQTNPYLAFLQEVRDIIQKNYWDTLTETQLVQLHVLAMEKLTALTLGDTIQTFEELDQKILELLDQYPDEQKKNEFSAQLADLVLANLEPFGRSRLYSEKLQQELVERVNNIDPEADHYQALGVDNDVSQEEIEQAYQEQEQILANDDSEAAQKKLAQIQAAHETLASQETRARYDQAGVNPTMEWRLVTPQIFYLKIKQFSATTIQELTEVTAKVDDRGAELDTLILDLRGNFGGAIDGLPYFLGPFIGNNQYAYQFIQQGKISDFKTKTGWLPTLQRYKKVVILIDDKTQSTGEVMASVIKKYNVGVLVGTTTMGWGTIERVFPVEHQINESEKYSVFLVHHLTLREDGTPIEGNGVEPMISITKANWKTELNQYFNDSALISAVAQQFTSTP